MLRRRITAFIAPGVRADEYKQLTYVTFSGAVQVPGAMLPAGTYTFKLADPSRRSSGDQIWNKENVAPVRDPAHDPNQRMEPADNPIVAVQGDTSRRIARRSGVVLSWQSGRTGIRLSEGPSDEDREASHQPVRSMAANSTAHGFGGLRGSR